MNCDAYHCVVLTSAFVARKGEGSRRDLGSVVVPCCAEVAQHCDGGVPQTPPKAAPVKAAPLVSPAGGADPEAFIAASPHKLPLSSLPAAHSEAGFAVVAEGVPNPPVIANVSKRTKVRQAKSTAVVSPLTAGQVATC